MDFTLTDTQEAIAGLAEQIFGGQVSVDRLKEIERSDSRFDTRLWSELARSNLVGLCLPEDDGGSGMGVIELALIVEQQGRRLAQVPLLWTAVAAMTIAEFGNHGQRSALTRVISGDDVLTLALSEPGVGDPLDPAVEAEPTDDGWCLSGTKLSVPWAHVATGVLVPARVAGRADLVVGLLDPMAPGVTRHRAEATNHEVLTHLDLDRVSVPLVAGPADGARATRFAMERALVGLCALQVGVAEEALAQAAAYTSTRLQFGKPLSSFQSTSARAADAYIDTEAMRATMWQAAWRLDTGLDASLAVEVAKWWASEAGQRVVHATQHLHGGIGADVEYPIHRYFLWGKQIEDTLGGGSAHLARIGAALAGTP